jgi:membrane-associated phospholipid phosphatase
MAVLLTIGCYEFTLISTFILHCLYPYIALAFTIATTLLHTIIRYSYLADGHSYVDFGMPSSHAQFMAFFAAVMPDLAGDASQTLLEGKHQKLAMMLIQSAALAGAVLVAYARIHLGYHTGEQVLVGSLTGFLAGHLWKLIQKVE